MSPHTWQLVLVAVLAFAAGLVFRDVVWLLRWRPHRPPDGATFGATGEVQPGEAVVFDWSDARAHTEPNIQMTSTIEGPIIATGSFAFAHMPTGKSRHLAAVPDER